MATRRDQVVSALAAAAKDISIHLRDKQREAVEEFMMSKDTFVSLPTGYGKSLIYGILPVAFDHFRCKSYTDCI